MHPGRLADDLAAAVAAGDAQRLSALLTPTVRLRALLPGGPVESHGRTDVAARMSGWFTDLDAVDVVGSAGEAVGDRLLVHYRLGLRRGATSWVCTQTALCKIVDGRPAVVDLLCSGYREIEDDDDHLPTPDPARARPVG